MATERPSGSNALTGPELGRALDTLNQVVADSLALEVLMPLALHADSALPKPDAMLRCFARLSAAHERMSEAEHGVLAALNLRVAFASTWWADLIAACNRQAMTEALAFQVGEICARLRFAATDLPKLTSLLQPPHSSGLVLVLASEDKSAPALAQISAAIDAVGLFAATIGSLNGSPASIRMSMTHDDSAVSLMFDGASATVAAIKLILGSISQHLAAFHATPAENHASVIAPSLEIMDEISGHPQAIRLRSMVDAGVQRFLDAQCQLVGGSAPAVQPYSAEAPGHRPDFRASDLRAADLRSADLHAPEERAADAVNLMELIAEERRHLAQARQADRRWPRTADRTSR